MVKPFSLQHEAFLTEYDDEFRGCAVGKLIYDSLGESGAREFIAETMKVGYKESFTANMLGMSEDYIKGVEVGYEGWGTSVTITDDFILGYDYGVSLR